MGHCELARLANKKAALIFQSGFFTEYSRQRSTLPWSCPHSTIDGIRLNFRVRNGNGCDPDPMTTGNLLALACGSRRRGLEPWSAARAIRAKFKELASLTTQYSANGCS